MLIGRIFGRNFSSMSSQIKGKVAVLGAAGGIGQPLSLLLKEMSEISQLSLYDIANIGMATDLSHISTRSTVTGYSGETQLNDCLKGAQVVVIPAGVPRKPGMTRDDLFNINASIVKNLSLACAKVCPDAHLLIISNPVNSTVPIACETLKKCGVREPKVYGITTLDIVRAKTFIGQLKGVDPQSVNVDVIGGHSGITIIPLLSSATVSSSSGSSGKRLDFTEEEIKSLTQRIQYGGDEVVKAKAGGGSATLSMAYAAREFVRPFLRALNESKSVTLTCFVPDSSFGEIGYFAGAVDFDSTGKVKVASIPKLTSPFEHDLYEKAIPELKMNIAKGIEFAIKE